MSVKHILNEQWYMYKFLHVIKKLLVLTTLKKGTVNY